MKKCFVVFATLLLFAAGAARTLAQHKLLAPLWGELSDGPYAVGFRNVYQFDHTRTWRITRRYERPFMPDVNGRPIRISIWYPAIHDERSRQMRFEDYVRPNGPKEFEELNHILEIREKEFSSFKLSLGRWSDLMAIHVNAYASATPVNRRFPLVLFAGSLNDTSTTSGSVLAEFLASHGYVVATVPILGPTNEDTEQGRTPSDRERTVQDLEVAWSMLRVQANVNETKVGVFGKSVGGIEAVIFAMRNANVSAVVGLDATYGFKSGTTALAEMHDFAPRKMHAGFLDLRRDWDDKAAVLDLTAEHAFRYSDRSFITVKKMHHRDFDAYTTVAFKFHLPLAQGEEDNSGWSRETGFLGYQNVCRLVLDFFDEKLMADHGGAERLVSDVDRADGGVLTHQNAVPIPPSAFDFVGIITKGGFDSATAVVDRYRREDPTETIVDQNAFNDLGYRLIANGQFPQAIGIMRLVDYAYPNSASAQDGLADAYIAAGEKDLARAALSRAIKLVPNDPSISDGQKQSFAKTEQAKLDQLKP